MVVPFTETIAWAALSWEENLRENDAVYEEKWRTQQSYCLQIKIRRTNFVTMWLIKPKQKLETFLIINSEKISCAA